MYKLIDTNPFYYNCGHYPDWEVVEDPDGPYKTFHEAEAKASQLNRKSDSNWRSYLES